jgi:chorismate mutase
LRGRVDAVDRRIVRLLGARQRFVAALKPLKSRLRDQGRETRVLRGVAREARRTGADLAFVRTVYRVLLAASRSFLRRQT